MTLSDTSHNTSHNDLKLTIDKPAIYCIQVIGDVNQRWSDRLAGLLITSLEKEGKQTITTLSRAIIDQAALFGVLKALYDMRLPLLSVEYLKIN